MGITGRVGALDPQRHLLRLRMRLWLRVREARLRVIPRPTDATRVQCAVEFAGNAADWVLVVGSGPARGWGVRSHNDALPGHLARALTARTGRSTDVIVVDAPSRVAVRKAVLLRVDAHYDAIVVVTGIEDAVALRCPESWRSAVREMLADITGESGVDSPIVMVGIPPIRSVPIFDSGMGVLAAAHALELNAITREVCAEFPHVSYAPLVYTGKPPLGQYRDSDTYRVWATSIARVVRPMLGKRRQSDTSEPI